MAEDRVVKVRVDSRIYSLEVAQRAAFRCTDLASFEFRIVDGATLEVTATVKANLQLDAAELTGRFNNELLDQKLRQTISDETKSERDLILAYAFSNTKLLG